jgi:hypothetical protein
VTAPSDGCVFGAALAIILHGDSGPAIHGIGQSRMAGKASDDDTHRPEGLVTRANAGQAAQAGVIAALHRIQAPAMSVASMMPSSGSGRIAVISLCITCGLRITEADCVQNSSLLTQIECIKTVHVRADK